MSAVFLKIVNMSISAGWIVFAVLLLRLFLNKAPKWINCVLWGIVGIRLVMPISFESMFSLIPSAETISKDVNSPRPYFESGFTAVDNQVNGYLKGSYFEGVTRPTHNFTDLTTILGIVWLVGIAVLLTYTVISFLMLKKKVSTAVLLCGKAFQSENVVSPFVLGVIRPKIYLPFNIGENDIQYVIAHEQAHIERKDHLWKSIGFLLLTLYWFNPILWLGYIFLCRDIELACDEKVIKELDGGQRADYSEALLSCSIKRRSISACPIAFGETDVKNRIKNILAYKKTAFWLIVIAIAICVAVGICFLTDPMSVKLKNMESLDIGLAADSAFYIFSSDGEAYQPIENVNKELLTELLNTEVSRAAVSKNRSKDRTKINTIVIRENAESDIGTYIHFNAVFSEVWVNTGVKPTLSYKVKNPEKVQRVYNEICYKNYIDLSDIETMNIGAEMPILMYADDNKVIFSGTCGVIVYDLDERRVDDRIPWNKINELGINLLNAHTSENGNTIYIGDAEKNYFTYKYDVSTRSLTTCDIQPIDLHLRDDMNFETYSSVIDKDKLTGEWMGKRESDILFLQADTDWSMNSLQLVICDNYTGFKEIIYVFE